MTSGKLCPVSTCSNGNGTGAGQNALIARCSNRVESLPPENRTTGRSNSPATSRKMWIASDSRASRLLVFRRTVTVSPSTVQSAFDLALARPPAAARIGARRHLRRAGSAADGEVPLGDQEVLQDLVFVDVPAELLVRPRRDRVDLHQAVAVVPLHDRRVRAGRRVHPAYARDPRVVVRQRTAQRNHLAQSTTAVRFTLVQPWSLGGVLFGDTLVRLGVDDVDPGV